jgi:exodeoxyribonuclease X
MRIRVVDLETGGFAPPAGVCEIAWTEVSYADDGSGWTVGRSETTLLKPATPMHKTAIEVHGITHDMVENAYSDANASNFLHWDGDFTHVCAHNLKFEKQWLDSRGKGEICTLLCAKRVFPTLRTYKNFDVFNAIGCHEWADMSRCTPLHRALPDTFVTACILVMMLQKHSLAELTDITAGKSIGNVLNYGQYKGIPIDDEKMIPNHYLKWVRDLSTLNPFNKQQAGDELKRRGVE